MSKIKDGDKCNKCNKNKAINLDEDKLIRNQWIPLYANDDVT